MDAYVLGIVMVDHRTIGTKKHQSCLSLPDAGNEDVVSSVSLSLPAYTHTHIRGQVVTGWQCRLGHLGEREDVGSPP